MGAPLTAEDRNQFTTPEVSHHLGFQGVLAFLAAVEIPLFFCGRSTTPSVTSVLTKAKTACEISGYQVSDHFVDVHKMVTLGSGS